MKLAQDLCVDSTTKKHNTCITHKDVARKNQRIQRNYPNKRKTSSGNYVKQMYKIIHYKWGKFPTVLPNKPPSFLEDYPSLNGVPVEAGLFAGTITTAKLKDSEAIFGDEGS